MAKIVVVGAGVSGLTSSFRLLQAGHSVEIWAKAFTPNTTSDVAAALWWPFHAQPADRVLGWCTESLRVFQQLSTDSTTGVGIHPAVFCFSSSDPPSWTTLIPEVTPLSESKLLPGCSSGVSGRVPLIEMNRYMPWLFNQVKEAGAVIQQKEILSLAEVVPPAEIVVNTTGLGSRELVGDPELYPVRGRVIRVEQIGVEEVLANEAGEWPTHILPRQNDIVLGGTYEERISELEVPPAMDEDIVQRCVAAEPRLATAHCLSTATGLRPARSSVRLELEKLQAGTPVIHNYGHGGAGVTLSWGCAEEVCSLVGSL